MPQVIPRRGTGFVRPLLGAAGGAVSSVAATLALFNHVPGEALAGAATSGAAFGAFTAEDPEAFCELFVCALAAATNDLICRFVIESPCMMIYVFASLCGGCSGIAVSVASTCVSRARLKRPG